MWSNYAGGGDAVRFVRVGTLDEPGRCPPDIHIFTSTKQPWVVLPRGVPAVAEYYKAASFGRRRVWSGGTGFAARMDCGAAWLAPTRYR